MAFLDAAIQEQLRKVFESLTEPVKLVVFTQANDGTNSIVCQMCAETRSLVEEVAELSDKISVEVYDFVEDEAVAQQYKIDKIPAVAITGGSEGKDYGIRLFGIPSGYEFSTLIQDIVQVSTGALDLSQKTLDEIAKLEEPVHIQVYVTPT